MPRRIFWFIVNLVMIGVILALIAAVLYPTYVGPSDDGEDRQFRTRQRNR